MGLVKIVGLVMPSEWDEFGNPLEFKICSHGEIDYGVSGPSSRRMRQFQSKWVVAEGISKSKGPSRSLELKNIARYEPTYDGDEE